MRVAALALAVLVFATSAQAETRRVATVTPQQAIAALNQERSENGIPAGIVENPSWSADCALHNHWMALNKTVAHDETPGSPGYTDGGHWAGLRSVLAGFFDGGWGPDVTPWENAPLHLMSLLAPELASVGAAVSESGHCMTTDPGYTRLGSTDVIYTYPADGRASVPYRQDAGELPFIPGQFVGLPLGTITGPYLYILADGPWTQDWVHVRPFSLTNQPHVSAASLTGPTGLVEVRTIGSDNSNINGYEPSGTAWVIPAKPLQPLAKYTASVTLTDYTGETLTKTWTFTTAGIENSLVIGDDLGFVSVDSTAKNVSVTARNLASGVTVALRTAEAQGSWQASDRGLPVGHYSVCASSGGPPTTYQPVTQCVNVEVKARALPLITVTPIVVRAGYANVTVKAKGDLIGRPASVEWGSGYLCGFASCGGRSYGGAQHTIRLRPSETFRVPSGDSLGWGSTLVMVVHDFTANGADYWGFYLDCYRNFQRQDHCEKRSNPGP